MKKVLRTLLVICIIGLALTGAAIALLYILVTTDMMTSFDPDKLGNYSQTTWVLDRNENVISGVYGTENRTYIDIENIPEQVRNVFIAAEDVRFYEHHGVDPIRIFGAFVANLRSGSLSQGASTITQQLIKNTHLTAEKTWSRKIEEAILALKVERAYTKDQILEMYLNYVYFGNGAYGIKTASYKYFGKDVDELTLAEAAALASTLKAPSNYAPHIQPENNKERRQQVLDTMLKEGFITETEAYEAKHEILKLTESGQDIRASGWYIDAVLEKAESILQVTSDEIVEMGLRIYTAMDSDMQATCDEVFNEDSLFPDDSADGTPCQSALVLMDSRTGEVLAMEGGRAYEVRKGFNRAIDGLRQPGSVLKPLAVYAPALERRIVTAATVMVDQKMNFDGYSPQNYGGKYYGAVTLRTAVARSLNVAPTQLLYEMGSQTGYESLVRFHMEPDASDTGLSLAVGSMKNGVTPLKLCAAYSSLSAGGVYHEPVLIRRIENQKGEIIYESDENAESVLEPSVAFVLNNLMQSVTSWGTGKMLGELDLPLASKTGTVGYDDKYNRDAWSVAYTPSLSMVCWMGFDMTDAVHALPSSVTGGKQPTALLKALLERLNLQPEDFIQPEQGVVWAKLDAQSMQSVGEPLLAGPYTAQEDIVYEVFVSGTEPTMVSDIRIQPQTPWDLTVTAGEDGYPLIEFTAPDEGTVYHIWRSFHGNAHEIAQLSGASGSKIAYLDTTAQRLYTYEYFVIAEYPQTGVYADPTGGIVYTVSLTSIEFPWGWVKNKD